MSKHMTRQIVCFVLLLLPVGCQGNKLKLVQVADGTGELQVLDSKDRHDSGSKLDSVAQDLYQDVRDSRHGDPPLLIQVATRSIRHP